jgi:hypothetical protein
MVMPLFLFYPMPVDYRSQGRKWSQMVGESTKRSSIADSASFPSRFALSPTIQLTFCGSNW